ncbi:MAG: sugar dehydrogenase [Noviherbaspirillum sp.]|nr:sugar dehydrogenase [Noviherbaspirillum sp.]
MRADFLSIGIHPFSGTNVNNNDNQPVGRILAALSICLTLSACGSGGGGSADAPRTSALGTAPAAQTVQAASVQATLEVPRSLADAAPFNETRSLNVPPGFGIRLWARVSGARFLARAPNGDILVSVPGEGKVVLLRNRPDDVPEQFTFASGLRKPHDMVFRTIGDTTYVYIAETHRVTRSVYQSGQTASAERQVVVDNLPDSSTPELQGSYGHELKNIAFGPDNKLYVSIASSCNACTTDNDSNPVRGAIHQYNADGSDARLYARGLRNAEGLDFLPGTDRLWITVNNRDDISFPLDTDFDGDGVNDLGRIVPGFTDDNPPELFTAVRDGGNYGWPFCNSVPNAAMSNLELRRDHDNNRDGARLDCALADRASKGIQAHAAPLGFSFLHDSNAPAAYRKGAVVAQHGCWNCTTLKAGYKVTYFPLDDAGNAGAEVDLVSGFVTDAVGRRFWGRPVDVIADAGGGILISDDYAGAVYQLYQKGTL